DPKAKQAGKSVLAGALELRSRLVKALLSFVAVALCLMPFSDRVFEIIAEPVIAKMPDTGSLIARQVASPFLTPLKATLWVSLFVAMPLLLYPLWRLADHWLPDTGRRIALPFVVTSALLFYSGVA